MIVNKRIKVGRGSGVVQGIFYGINWLKLFLKDVWEETNPQSGRVSWPNRRMVLGATAAVLVAIIFATFVIWFFDMISSLIVKLIIGR